MRSVNRLAVMILVGSAACIDATAPKSGEMSLAMPASPGILDSGHVVLTGPTPKTVTLTPGATVTIGGLDPGTYTVGLVGFYGGGAAYTAQVSGVTVVAGQNTTPTVPALVASFGVTVSPATGSIAPGATQQFTAVAKDAQNNTISPITFFWASSNQNAALVDQTGLATGVAGGTVTISALGLGVPGSAALTVTGGVPTQLAISSQPTNATAGASISPAVQIEVQDAGGNRITTARNAVTLAIGTNAGSGTLSGTLTANAVAGVATFSGLSIDRVGTGYTLTASSGTLTGVTSAAFDIAAGQPTQLAFTTQPPNVRLGAVIAPAVQVAIRDALGNTVTGASNSVTLAIGSNPSGGSLAGTLTMAAAAGVATFSTLSILETGAGYTLTATSGALPGATSNPFNVTFSAVVANEGSNDVSFIETASNTVVNTVALAAGTHPVHLAFTPDAAHIYIADISTANVSVIDTATNTVVATVGLPAGASPWEIKITPDGASAYVANQGLNSVSVISTATNALTTTIALPAGSTAPSGVAITPNGLRVYVTNHTSSNVSVINRATNTVTATVTLAAGSNPYGVAITPSGAFAYVTNSGTNNVTVIRTSDNTIVTTIPVGAFPVGIAFTPDGAFAYVVNINSGTVSVIRTSINSVVDAVAVGLGDTPTYVAITPGGAFAYVTNETSNDISVIATVTNKVVATIPVGTVPFGIAIPRAP